MSVRILIKNLQFTTAHTCNWVMYRPDSLAPSKPKNCPPTLMEKGANCPSPTRNSWCPHYSGRKSCVSQDSRLYLARLFSQDLNCKTCKTTIHKKTLFFRPKMGHFQKIVQMRVEKKFSNYFFHV